MTVQNQQTEVELIPWAHNAKMFLHKVVVDYVKQIPKNSVLLIEANPGIVIALQKLSHMLLDKKPSQTYGGKEEQETFTIFKELKKQSKNMKGLSYDTLAYLEVLIEAGKRNLQVIPIETNVSRAYKTSPKQTRSEFREQTMVGKISEIARTKNQGKIYALTGFAHINEIMAKLRARGLRTADVDFSKIPGTEKYVEDIAYLVQKLSKAKKINEQRRKAEVEGNKDLEHQLKEQIENLLLDPSGRSLKESREEITYLLRTKEEKIRQRILRRRGIDIKSARRPKPTIKQRLRRFANFIRKRKRPILPR